MIYLDSAATSFFKPKQVIDATMEAVNKYTANAGRGAYKVAQETSMKILDCRDKCVKLFGEEFECIFTPGCSYSLNLAILGTVKRNSHIITTYLEHNSVLRVLEMLKINGIIDYTVLTDFSKQNIEKYIKPNTTTIITTHVSNVTGEEIDLNLFSQICKEHGLIYIVDSAQGAGHCDADYSVADIVAFAGHKGLRSLMGVGGLMVKHHIKLKPIIFGGTGLKSKELVQPNDVPEGFEVGSLNAISIISLEAGINNFLRDKKIIIEKEEELTQYLIKKLKGLKFVKCYSKIENCKGVVAFNISNFDSGLVANILSEEFDVCCRSGFHCAPLVHKYYKTENQGMIRASINSDNSVEEIDEFISILSKVYNKLTSQTNYLT